MTDPNKLAIDDVENLSLLLMTKAPYEHKHRFDDIEGYDHLLKTLYTTLASQQHTHEAIDIPSLETLVNTVSVLESKVEELANKPSVTFKQPQTAQVIQQVITPQPIETKAPNKIGYKDISDLTELFDIIKRRSQPRLTVIAKEPTEERILNIAVTIVNPMGYCLCKAKLELIDLTTNNILSTVKYSELTNATFMLSILVPENERFKGYVRLTDPMNNELSIMEHVRIQG